jgi:hypothetical protein
MEKNFKKYIYQKCNNKTTEFVTIALGEGYFCNVALAANMSKALPNLHDVRHEFS